MGEGLSFLDKLEAVAGSGECSLFQFCTEIAKGFKVRPHEVAVLALQHSMLQFVYPPELRSAGMIPLISSAQVARTANSRRAEIFNNFYKVRHSSVFEAIRITPSDPQTIQKLMSAPVLTSAGGVFGVMQVCRKGTSPREAGPDFTSADLGLLQQAATLLGRVAGKLQDRNLEPLKPAAGA